MLQQEEEEDAALIFLFHLRIAKRRKRHFRVHYCISRRLVWQSHVWDVNDNLMSDWVARRFLQVLRMGPSMFYEMLPRMAKQDQMLCKSLNPWTTVAIIMCFLATGSSCKQRHLTLWSRGVYHNVKGFFSIILYHGHYKLMWVDVRANGPTSDCAVFNDSDLKLTLGH